jgi:hypothetical protein
MTFGRTGLLCFEVSQQPLKRLLVSAVVLPVAEVGDLAAASSWESLPV